MVAPERETPGIRATHWTRPTISESSIVRSRSPRSLRPTRSAYTITALQRIKAKATTHSDRSGPVMKDKPGAPNAFGTGPAYPGVTETVYDPKDVIVPAWLPDNLPVRAELAMYYQAVTRLDQGVGRQLAGVFQAGRGEVVVLVLAHVGTQVGRQGGAGLHQSIPVAIGDDVDLGVGVVGAVPR